MRVVKFDLARIMNLNSAYKTSKLTNKKGLLQDRTRTDMRKIAIIGAGPSGLCSARHLTALPNNFQVKVFEKCHRVGGTWVYTTVERDGEVVSSRSVHSSMYKNLRLVDNHNILLPS